jgi:hypothetical protein
MSRADDEDEVWSIATVRCPESGIDKAVASDNLRVGNKKTGRRESGVILNLKF